MENPLKTSSDWMGASTDPLKGFSWAKGSTRDTNGLVIWSDIFFETTEKGEKLAILLADTQGLFGEKVILVFFINIINCHAKRFLKN